MLAEYRIAVDVMGGDDAPGAIINGVKAALAEMDDIRIILCGPEEVVRPLESSRISVVPTTEVIGMDESPMMAVRRKGDSSLVRAMLEVREKRADAVVSAGSTGAILAGGMFRIGRIKGVERPALAPVLPGLRGPVLLLDVGANVDCQPKYLNQFGLMGSAYMNGVMGFDNPKVGLVNIGVEDEKGNKLAKEARLLMQEQTSYNFVGNVEAREIASGDYQVMVFDGFDGNLVLKHTEGLASALTGMLKEELMSSMRTKIGAMIIKPALKRFKKRMDYHEQGGAPLLGIDGVVIKAHGSSNGRAICSAIRQARTMIINDIVGKISAGLSGLAEE